MSTPDDRGDLDRSVGTDADARRRDERHAAAGRNTVALLLSRLAIAVMGWSGTVLIARLLSPTDWGVFSYVFGLLGMMSIITDLGVGRVVLGRLLEADDQEADVFASSFVGLRAALGLLGYGIAVAYVAAMGYSGDVVRATALAGLVVVIATPSNALSVLYQSRLRMVTVAAAEASAQMFQLILTVLIATTHPGMLIFILPAIANEIFSGTWKLIGVRRGAVGPRITKMPRIKLWREMLVEAIPLSVGLAMMTLLSKIDILMLGQLDRFDSVGLYSVAYKFADVLSYAVIAIVTPVATLLVAAWPLMTADFRTRVRSAAVTMGLLTCLAIVGMWASGDEIVSFLYGARFVVCADAVRMLLVGAVFAALSHLILVALVSASRQRAYPWVSFGALMLNIGLNLYLIPRFSFNGSAAATVVTEFVMFAAMWVLMSKTLPIDRLIPVAKLLLTAGLTVAVCAVTTAIAGHLHWVLVSACAVFLFVVGAVMLRLVDRQTLWRFRPVRAEG
ncbi:flippase [Mycolicibacterium sp. CBMA 226]|uniref:flippase n=1 Tax=Mycolicibacterium sp. CBMA 226 TaxID=2606611 RepID=UPI0012DD6D2A|nr:flippase [Mycolicibacterium sp. CBMA 226]MUL78127.1 flippase [Mycolicibacterium sp. CBMA 226]